MAVSFGRELKGATGKVAQHGCGGAGLEVPFGPEAKPRGGARHRERAFPPELRAQLFRGGDDEGEDLLLSDPRCLDRGAPGGQQHRERLALTCRPRRAEPGARERFARGPDGVERVGLRAVAAPGSLGAVQLDDELAAACQVAGQAGAVAAGSLDRPGPQTRVLARELNECLVSLGGRLDGDLGEHPAGPGASCRGAGRRDVGVDADHNVSDLRETVHALLLCPEGRNRFRSGRRQAGL